MPKLWTDTIDAHREAVRAAVLDVAGGLVAERGLHGVTMSALAARSGIGRATLYKYFGDAGAVLAAWHGRLIEEHLAELAAIARDAATPEARLARALTRLAELRHAAARHAHGPHAAALHTATGLAEADARLRELLAELIAAAPVRDDLPADALAALCLHALGAAAEQPTPAAARRIAAVVLTGLTGTLRSRG